MMQIMINAKRRRHEGLIPALAAVALVALAASGCGGDGSKDASQTSRAAGASLQQAMDDAARNIDEVQGKRSSLDRLSSNLKPSIAQTGDVVVTLTPNGGNGGAEAALLNAARSQRSFLQFAADAAAARSKTAANSAVGRARSFGRQASSAYASIAQDYSTMAGVLPASTTFNIGQLKRAVRQANRRHKKWVAPAKPTEGTAPNAPYTYNSVTSAEFAQNVYNEYLRTGSSVIYAWSPAKNQEYQMICTGNPTVCRGGNNAEVTIR